MGYVGVGINWQDPKYLSRLRDLIIEGKNNSQISEILTKEWNTSVSHSAVDNARIRHLANLEKYIEEQENTIEFYDADTLPMDDYMISCDDHSPYFSALWENRLLSVAEFFKVKKHIKVGDLINQDYASHWAKLEGEKRGELDEDIQQSEPLFKALDYFDEIYLVRGNHEDRITRMTDARVQGRHILKLFGERIHQKFKYTPYDKVFIGDDWMAVHPKSYSQISGSTAIRLAEKYRRHVLNAHGHFVALRWDRSGQNMGIDLGGLFDTRKIPYCNLSTSTHPVWNNGFAMLKDGKIWLWNESTDWDFWNKQLMRRLA